MVHLSCGSCLSQIFLVIEEHLFLGIVGSGDVCVCVCGGGGLKALALQE